MAADHCDLVALITHGPVIIEREGELGVPIDEMGWLEQSSRQRIVGSASPARTLVEQSAHRPLLGVAHEYDALGRTVGDDGPGRSDAISAISLNPFITLDTDPLRVLGVHPDGLVPASQRQHVRIIEVLEMDRPLVVGGEVAHCDFGRPLRRGPRSVNFDAPIQTAEVQRKPEDQQRLLELLRPIVVDVELWVPGQCVSGFVPFDVLDEGVVSVPAVPGARPFG